jgi:glycosyltransferase involved in cell wall biosynthesis
MKKVSLYIPTHDSGEYLEESLKSVFSQTVKFSEIIVVDEASKDNTLKIAEKFRVRVVKINDGSGLACARNTGLNHARYDYVASIDSDVALDKNWLKNIMKNFEDKKILGASGQLVEDMHGYYVDWRRIHMAQNWGENKLLNPDFMFGSNCVLDKKKIKPAGGYDERYKTNYEDVDFSHRLRAKGLVYVYDPRSICYHRKNDSLLSLMKSYYRWNYFAYPLPKSFGNLLFRFFIANPYSLFNLIKTDLYWLSLLNFPLDILIILSHYILDIKSYLKK